ncbi:hypothetical protein [Paenibacillus sp. FSL H8-0168]|uniref:hypothetical protein n=1 Tax=Paenibacillus sp. FSL H8-0168 TaxID=2921378 RepID=UPI0031587BB0
MGYELKWSDNINLDESKLRGLEERWNIRFPKEYVEIVLNHDGSVPYIIDQNGEEITGVVEVPGKLTWSIQLLSLIEKEVLGEVISPIELAYDTLSEALPKKYISLCY